MSLDIRYRPVAELVELSTERIAGQKDPYLPYVGLEHIVQGEPFLLGVASSDTSTSTNSVFRRGDILFGKLRPNLRKSLQVDFDGYCSTDILVLRSQLGVDPGFAARVLQGEAVLRRAVQTAIGTRMPRTSWDDLKPLFVFVPPLPEQRRIAEILDTADEAIRQTEQVIAKLKAVKAGLLHDLLTRGLDERGRLRDPQAHPEQFKDTPLGRIPKAWEVYRLLDLSVGGISNGFFKKPDLVGSGYPLINVLDLYRGFGIDVNLVERVRASEQEQLRYSVQPGDCFFTRSSLNLTGIAHCNVIRDVPEPTLFECHVMRLRPDKNRLVPEFLAYWCRSSWARRFLVARARQVTMTTIAQPDLAPLPVPLPSREEQQRAIEVLDAHDARIHAEEAALAKLRQVKRGLMDDLLTGRVRVQT